MTSFQCFLAFESEICFLCRRNEEDSELTVKIIPLEFQPADATLWTLKNSTSYKIYVLRMSRHGTNNK